MVTTCEYPNGLPETRGLARELVRAGVDLTVVCSQVSTVELASVEPRLVEAGPVRGIRGAFDFSREVARVLQRVDVDLVHVYPFRGCALLPVSANGPRYLLDVRTGNVSGRPWPWARVSDGVTRVESRAYDGRAVISRAVGRYVGGRGWDNSVVIPLGYPAQAAAAARAQRDARLHRASSPAIRIGYVGTLKPQRRLERLVEAAGELRRRGCPLTWIMVGGGGARPALEQQALASGVGESFEFRGEVPSDGVWEQYADLDISLAYVPAVPHFDRQPPVKTLEAMACGLPVIGTDTVGNREFIRDGVDGILVRDDVAALADAIERLAQDPAARRRLGERAAERVRDCSWEQIVRESLLPAYARLLG